MLKLPPGNYFIGDPEAVFQEETYESLLEATHNFETGDIETLNGTQIWGHATSFGAGTFEDQNGVEYETESGIIAAIPIELIDLPAGEEKGLIIECPKGMVVEFNNGTFWLGPVCIKTNSDLDMDFDDDEIDGGYDLDLSLDSFK